MRLYKRGLRVIVGDNDEAVQIDSLRITIEIKKTASGKPAEGVVKIYNLNESTETRIRRRGERIRVLVGYNNDYVVPDSNGLTINDDPEYESSLSAIHDGQIRQVERVNEGLDRVTHITLGGNVFNITQANSDVSYSGPVSVRRVVQDVLPDFGLDSFGVEGLPTDQLHDFMFSGRTSELVDKILNPLGVQWIERNGSIVFSKRGEPIGDFGPLIRAGAGLIGSPAVTDKGIKAKVLMDPRIEIGTRIRIESTVLGNAASGDAESARAAESEGVYKVVQLLHRGCNRDGEFVTEFEGVPA